MVDFTELTRRAKQHQKTVSIMIELRFGLAYTMETLCKRCGRRYGSHYFDFHCVDEVRKLYPHIEWD